MKAAKHAPMIMAALLLACIAHGGDTPPIQSVPLFNGKDLSGFTPFLPDAKADPAKTWSVKNKVLHCTGAPAGYLRTEKIHENYRLRLEWRWPAAPGNNGVLLHIQQPDQVWPKSIEAQLLHLNAGDFFVIEGSEFKEHTNPLNRRVAKREPASEKPLGEWNEFIAECRGNAIKVWVNGVLQNVATGANVAKGCIGLQSEGAAIEYRHITLTPLQ